MALKLFSVDQLIDMRQKLIDKLYSLNPEVDPETSAKEIVKARNIMLAGNLIEDKKIALAGFIEDLKEKIFRVYLDRIQSFEKLNNKQSAVDLMNQYYQTVILPFEIENDSRKWKEALAKWKKSKKTGMDYVEIFGHFQNQRFQFII